MDTILVARVVSEAAEASLLTSSVKQAADLLLPAHTDFGSFVEVSAGVNLATSTFQDFRAYMINALKNRCRKTVENEALVAARYAQSSLIDESKGDISELLEGLDIQLKHVLKRCEGLHDSVSPFFQRWCFVFGLACLPVLYYGVHAKMGPWSLIMLAPFIGYVATSWWIYRSSKRKAMAEGKKFRAVLVSKGHSAKLKKLVSDEKAKEIIQGAFPSKE